TLGAEAAWALNLPLPRRYQFAYTLAHGAGGSAFYWFMWSLGMRCANSWVGDDWAYFRENYEALVRGGGGFWVWILHYAFWHYKKSLALLDFDRPLLILVRDPISTFKHIINHQHGSSRKKDEFKLGDAYEELIPDILYNHARREGAGWVVEKKTTPSIENLHSHGGSMQFDLVRKWVPHSEVFYLDMQEILPQNAFLTLQKLALQFGFTPPKPKEREFYETMHNSGGLVVILDFRVVLCEGVVVWVDSAKTRRHLNENFINLNEEILGEDPKNFKLCMERRALELLLEKGGLMQEAKIYLRGLYRHYLQRVESEAKKLLSEAQVLEYFEKNRDLALQYKKAFDAELADIKQKRPDIVASWKHYAEFERICAGFGGAAGG
ncbi:DUF2972 domain-containing protein, partial [Campylobacter sp.]|uniref:DUF2972 domain-containing protein n=1 Tax=Campylobacter sp. TaxID=205 RepID=UPI0026DDCA1E